MELNKKGLPFFPELRFEDKRHIYTLGGQILPSVTTVMKPLDEALYRGIDESVMQMAAERGTGRPHTARPLSHNLQAGVSGDRADEGRAHGVGSDL